MRLTASLGAALTALLLTSAVVAQDSSSEPPPHRYPMIAVGWIKSVSPGRLVLVTDRNQTVDLPKGSTMRFVLNAGTRVYNYETPVPASAIRVGGSATVTYLKEENPWTAMEVRLLGIPSGYRSQASPAPYSPSARTHRPDGGFEFTDLRVQTLNKKGAPARLRVRSGQKFFIVVYARATEAIRARGVTSYTMTDKGEQTGSDRMTVPAISAGDGFHASFGGQIIWLTTSRPEEKYVIRASVTLNGVTKTRTTRFTVYSTSLRLRRQFAAIKALMALPAGGFDFTDLRVQTLDKDGAPARLRVRSGQKFTIAVYFDTTEAIRAGGVISYTMFHDGRQMDSDRETLPAAHSAAAKFCIRFNLSLAVDPPARDQAYVIRASVTLNGITKTRTTRFTVYR